MKKVAIDISVLNQGHAGRGVGWHTSELVKSFDLVAKKHPDLKITMADFGKTDLSKFDLAHYQYFRPYDLSLPAKKVTRNLLTIHDLIYLKYPKAYPAGFRGTLKFWIQKSRLSNFDAFLTISETSKNDIVKMLHIPPEKIFVVYLAQRKIYKPITSQKLINDVRDKYHLPKQFILYSAGVNYNKNLISLAQACRKINVPLVVTGKEAAKTDFNFNHPENKPFGTFLKEFGESKDVMRIGFVPDDELVTLFNLAAVYSQPSFDEGFGLPILQAFACGTPVVASDIEVYREIADDACVYADPYSVNAIADGLTSVLTNKKLRDTKIACGFEVARKYSWKKTADQTMKVYEKIIGL